MPFTTVKVIEGVFSKEQKAQLIEKITEAMVGELEREVSCEVFDRRDFLEHLAKATLEEDLEWLALDTEKIG